MKLDVIHFSPREGDALEAEVLLKFRNSQFARALGFERHQKVYLQLNSDSKLFELDNESENLRLDFWGRSAKVDFYPSLIFDKCLIEVYESRVWLNPDLKSKVSDDVKLFETRFNYEVLKSDYNCEDTNRLVYEMCAEIALITRDTITYWAV